MIPIIPIILAIYSGDTKKGGGEEETENRRLVLGDTWCSTSVSTFFFFVGVVLQRTRRGRYSTYLPTYLPTYSEEVDVVYMNIERGREGVNE